MNHVRMRFVANGASLILSLTFSKIMLVHGFENEDDLNLLLLDNIICGLMLSILYNI